MPRCQSGVGTRTSYFLARRHCKSTLGGWTRNLPSGSSGVTLGSFFTRKPPGSSFWLKGPDQENKQPIPCESPLISIKTYTSTLILGERALNALSRIQQPRVRLRRLITSRELGVWMHLASGHPRLVKRFAQNPGAAPRGLAPS